MRQVAGVALTTAALFLGVVAVLLGSSALFYMSTAMIVTIAASRLQAWLSVRGLRFERIAPLAVSQGDIVTIEILVWSERRIRRPLITIYDDLPEQMHPSDVTLSLPIAPAYDVPIRSQYQFRARRRGRFTWSSLTAAGTDALGLVTMLRHYKTEPTELTVLPNAVPVSVEAPIMSSWGYSELESGRSRGAGLEPRGVREYVVGDSLRHIHWRSSAKSGRLLVKEFESGSTSPIAFFLQDTVGSELGGRDMTSLDLMCGHVIHLAEKFLQQGAFAYFPGREDKTATSEVPHDRIEQIRYLLAGVSSTRAEPLSEHVQSEMPHLLAGTIVYLLVSVAEEALIDTVRKASGQGFPVVALLYDPADFIADTRKSKRVENPSSPDFMDSLRRAGAYPLHMPTHQLVER